MRLDCSRIVDGASIHDFLAINNKVLVGLDNHVLGVCFQGVTIEPFWNLRRCHNKRFC